MAQQLVPRPGSNGLIEVATRAGSPRPSGRILSQAPGRPGYKERQRNHRRQGTTITASGRAFPKRSPEFRRWAGAKVSSVGRSTNYQFRLYQYFTRCLHKIFPSALIKHTHSNQCKFINWLFYSC